MQVATLYRVVWNDVAGSVTWQWHNWENKGVENIVLGKFGPRLIGTRSGLDQTQRSQSQSGIFPRTRDHLVSGLGNSILPETVPDPVWTGTA